MVKISTRKKSETPIWPLGDGVLAEGGHCGTVVHCRILWHCGSLVVWYCGSLVVWFTEGGTGNEPGVGSKQPPAYLQSTPVHLKANVKLVQTARRQHCVHV